MTLHYDPVDDISYFVMLGDTCRYVLDPFPGGFSLVGYVAAGYADPGFDDSGWSVGPQPFVSSVVPDPATLFTPRPFGENTPPWAYTAIPSGTRIACRVAFTVAAAPAALMAPHPTFGRVGQWHDGVISTFLDGVQIGATEGGTAFDTFAPSLLLGEEWATAGSHLFAFTGVGDAIGATLYWLHRLFSQPPLRQFPRDDALGGTPRQGRHSRSVQASTRQGWSGTYR